MPLPTRQRIIHSYRHLYRALLKAVQYSHPARTTCRDQLRNAYRNEPPSNFDKTKIHRTVEFLEGAARERGMEHKILKNLLHTRYLHKMNAANIMNLNQMNQSTKVKQKDLNAMKIKKTAYLHYDMTLAMLNDRASQDWVVLPGSVVDVRERMRSDRAEEVFEIWDLAGSL